MLADFDNIMEDIYRTAARTQQRMKGMVEYLSTPPNASDDDVAAYWHKAQREAGENLTRAHNRTKHAA